MPPVKRTDPPDDHRAAEVAGVAAVVAVSAAPVVPPAEVAGTSANVAGHAVTAARFAVILAALRRFFARKQVDDTKFIAATLREQYPEEEDGIIRAAVAQEVEYERAFQAKALKRVERDFQEAGRIEDPSARQARVRAILSREKHYLEMRSTQMMTRSVAALERSLLKRLSPEGAYWRLSPHVKEHTLDCLYMGGKWWPWDVLDIIHPPMHQGCPCMLFSKDEAVEQGLMAASDALPDPKGAVHSAKTAIEKIRALNEVAYEYEVEHLVEAAYNEILHPRDRRGHWRDVPDVRPEVKAAFGDLVSTHHVLGSDAVPTKTTAPILPMNPAEAWVHSTGLKVYKVGGATRDPLLGKTPDDIDYIAMHTPEHIMDAVREAGGHAEALTVRDRLVGVRAYHKDLPPGGVEIAPPRVERSTGPGRQDFEIVPHPDLGHPAANEDMMLEDDAYRRDFTVNSVFQNPNTGEYIDPLGGRADIASKVLRTTHPDSFRDDPLRILRMARFASQHGLTPDEATLAQAREHADAVTALTQKGVSGSVRKELDKLLGSEDPAKGLKLLRDTGALASLLPEFAPSIGFDQESKWHDLTVDEHIFRVVEEVARQNGSAEARMAALFHDTGKPATAWRGKEGNLHFYAFKEGGSNTPPPDARDHADVGAEIAEGALRRLNYPRAVIDDVVNIVREHMLTAADKPKPLKARKLRTRLSDKVLADLFIHRRADMRGKGEDDDPANPTPTPTIDALEQMVADAAAEGVPRNVAELKINGRDLMDEGYIPGPAMGQLLRDLLHEVIAQPKLNTREWLLAQAGKRRRKLQGEHTKPTEEEAVLTEAWMKRRALLGGDLDVGDLEVRLGRLQN